MDIFPTNELVGEEAIQRLPAFFSLEPHVSEFERDDFTSHSLSPDSDQQLVIDNSDIIKDEPKKRKGGWPKGKKRKRDTFQCKIPKAPVTGYILFLNERRKFYKVTQPDLGFSNVTKLLGKEWSNLNLIEKQKYLDRAEADKKRYREELHILRNQNILKQGNDKRDHIRLEIGDVSAGLRDDDSNDEISEELCCRVCDQFFVSLHNKNEHLYGKHHLQMLAERACTDNSRTVAVSKTSSRMELSLNDNSNGLKSVDNTKPTNLNQAISEFIELSIDRIDEIMILKEHLEVNKQKYQNLRMETEKYQERENKLRHQLDGFIMNKASLKEQLETLRMVPSLFGVINFQH